MSDGAPLLRLTHIGGPTVLIEVGSWRILTDPTFDAPGRRYKFGWGTASTKVAAPAMSVAEVGFVDAVLLTHDHHADNLDDSGRVLLDAVPTVVTTPSGARRLGRTVRGLAPGEAMTLSDGVRPSVVVTATPCRHGPPLFRPIVGEVIGFALTWPGQARGALWISGDTVVHRGVLDFADRVPVGVAVLHLGGVRFPVTGPLRYTMTAGEAVRLCERLRPEVVFPVHYEGWSHFVEGRAAIERRLADAPAEVRSAFRWLPLGTPTAVEA